jgi:NAD(P)-dependent dehydrogenase (short-subunit alcohol dehydrogenase family)
VLAARRLDRLDDLAAAIRRDGGTALVVEADLTDQQQAVEVVEHAVAELDRLDTLVNNAGIMLLGPALDAPTEEWDRMTSPMQWRTSSPVTAGWQSTKSSFAPATRPGSAAASDEFGYQIWRSCAPSLRSRSCSWRSSGVTTGVSAGRCLRTSATGTFLIVGSGYSLARFQRIWMTPHG